MKKVFRPGSAVAYVILMMLTAAIAKAGERTYSHPRLQAQGEYVTRSASPPPAVESLKTGG